MNQYNKAVVKMINYDDVTKENINEYNLNWPQIYDLPYRIIIIGDSKSGKTNTLLNLIKQQGDDSYTILDKTYLYAKDSYEPKYQYLIKKYKSKSLRKLKNLKHFVEYFNNMKDVYKNIQGHDPS